jgi:hypothetical protein
LIYLPHGSINISLLRSEADLKRRTKPNQTYLRRLAAWSQIGGGLATVILMVATLLLVLFADRQIKQIRDQLSDQRQFESANLMLSFNQHFRNEKNSKLVDAIASGRPLLEKNKGPFSEADLDDYLVMFELLDTVYDNHLITREMVDDAFSFDIEKAYQNKETQSFMAQVRSQENDNALYGGFEKLNREFSRHR